MNRFRVSVIFLFTVAVFCTGESVIGGELETVLEKVEQGDANAQNYLGIMYAQGRGVNQNFKQAVHWFSKAAEKDQPSACNNLGMMYYLAKGVIKDYGKAAHWFKKGADLGYVDAQYNLGLMYYRGKVNTYGGGGVPQDYQQAFKWFKKAAEQGHSCSANTLAMMHFKGHGCPRDCIAAYVWNARAVDLGDYKALQNKKKIMAQMTPEQKKQAQSAIERLRAKAAAAEAQSDEE